MLIVSFAHAGLKRLYLADQRRGVPADAVGKLRHMLAFLQTMEHADELRTLPTWRAHRLTGSRAGTWALHVTRNWRLTFRIVNNEVRELNLEDYH